MIDIEKIRADTPSCQEIIHFNNAGASLMPKPVFAALQRVLEDENRLGGYEAERRAQPDIHGFYAAFGALLNADPDEIAYAVAFLASERAAFVTGSNLAINGGQHMF